MMIKVFTTDKNGKIVLSGKELKELLDEAYWEGYRANNRTWTYTTPSWTPFYYTTSTSGGTTISLSNEAKSASNNTTTATNATVSGSVYTGQGNSITATL